MKPSKLKKEIEETVVDLLNNHLDEDEEPKNWNSPSGKATVDAYTGEILSLCSKVIDDVIKQIEERRDMEKFIAENHETEKEYKRGKYVGLRYAVDLARQRKKKFIE